MGAFSIDSVTISAFRSFVEPATFSFLPTGNVLIRGVNRDTKGMSAIGKTTLTLAISYAFDFCPLPATELQSWHTKAPFQVEIRGKSDYGPFVLLRGSKNNSIQVGEEARITGSTPAVKERVRQMTGMDPKLLQALTSREQDEKGIFLSKTNEEKQEFLSALIPEMKMLDTQIEVFEAEISKLATAAAVAMDRTKRTAEEISQREVAVASTFVPVEPVYEDLTSFVQKIQLAESYSDQSASKVVDIKKQRADALLAEAASAAASDQKFQDLITEAQERVRLCELPDNFQQDRSVLEAGLQEISDVRARLNERVLADAQARNAQAVVAKQIEAKLLSVRATLSTFDSKRIELRRLQTEREALSRSVCPTCSRTWDEAQKKIAEKDASILAIETMLAQEPALKLQVTEFQAELVQQQTFVPDSMIQRLQEIRTALEAKMAAEDQRLSGEKALRAQKLRSLWSEASVHLQTIQSQKEAARGQILSDPKRPSVIFSSQLEDAQILASSARENVLKTHAAKEQVVARNTILRQQFEIDAADYAAKCTALLTAKANYENYQKLQAAAEDKVSTEKDFCGMAREFLSQFFGQILAEISDETNAILAGVANTANCTLQFKPDGTTRNGKRSIVPVLTVGGHEGSLKGGASGGQRSSIYLASDLAVASVVCKRLKASPGWLILDEPFNGLGMVEKETAMEILQRFAADRCVLVVDHAAEFKEMFQQTIEIEFAGGYSKILAQ